MKIKDDDCFDQQMMMQWIKEMSSFGARRAGKGVKLALKIKNFSLNNLNHLD